MSLVRVEHAERVGRRRGDPRGAGRGGGSGGRLRRVAVPVQGLAGVQQAYVDEVFVAGQDLAFVAVQAQQEAEASGIDVFMPKPVKFAELKKILTVKKKEEE